MALLLPTQVTWSPLRTCNSTYYIHKVCFRLSCRQCLPPPRSAHKFDEGLRALITKQLRLWTAGALPADLHPSAHADAHSAAPAAFAVAAAAAELAAGQGRQVGGAGGPGWGLGHVRGGPGEDAVCGTWSKGACRMYRSTAPCAHDYCYTRAVVLSSPPLRSLLLQAAFAKAEEAAARAAGPAASSLPSFSGPSFMYAGMVAPASTRSE